ncbi:MAG: DNA adenine methylase [Bacillota bacterium]
MALAHLNGVQQGAREAARNPSAAAPRCLYAVNPATVPQRSPFRYPGGKTWFIPFVRQWLRSISCPGLQIVEPFAGGAIVGLTAAFESLVSRVTLVELDPNVAAVWMTILNGGGSRLAERYASFEPNAESVHAVLSAIPHSTEERAFHTLLRNRTSRGGIMAPGSGLIKRGENGKGLSSRWYPETIRRRILDIVGLRDRIGFIQGDGLAVMKAQSSNPSIAWFIDPPYTVAGKRLYAYSEVDHAELFRIAGGLAGDFVITYDASPEIESLAEGSGFQSRRVMMKTTHHDQKYELIIGRNLEWLDT